MQEHKQPICYIVGSSGEFPHHFPSFQVRTEDYVIAADGGYLSLFSTNMRIDLLIGDFDSLADEPNRLSNNPPASIVHLPKEKDATDMLMAVRHGLKKGYREFYIYGGTGGSMRHVYANIQLLAMLADCGARGYLFGRDETMTIIKHTDIQFHAQSGYLSVFAFGGKAEGVTLKNLKFPLKNYTMSDIYPIGVSNEFLNLPASVSVANGTLLLIYSNS